jgi:hypothetical protein
VRVAAHDERHSDQRRLLQHLDRREERVEVEMGDDAAHKDEATTSFPRK